ncbi:MAG: tRNA lysidine(34) synthetase TilS [Planctomycetota bacterium]|nr:tRNA lysidine(34) synthetase TilS [Planctomycetota bacterium]
MQHPAMDMEAVRREPAARRIVRSWRALTGGRAVVDADRRTLVACSGGADSTALAVVLAATGAGGVVLGHVVHDFRDGAETAAERDRVAGLAARLGVGFVETSVAVRGHVGNAEGNARRARYRELERLAFEAGCPFVATGHHADDQLETVLMGLLRGAGVGGLGGVRPRRALGVNGAKGSRGVELVRPMLEVGRADAERLCACAGVDWATDPTNADLSRFRAAIRHSVLPGLAKIRPTGAARAVESARQMREISDLLETLAGALLARAARDGGAICWERSELAGAHPAVASAALRLGFAQLHGGRLADRLAARSVRRVVEAIGCVGGVGGAGASDANGMRGTRTNSDPKRFVWKATEVTVTPTSVTMRSTSDG